MAAEFRTEKWLLLLSPVPLFPVPQCVPAHSRLPQPARQRALGCHHPSRGSLPCWDQARQCLASQTCSTGSHSSHQLIPHTVVSPQLAHKVRARRRMCCFPTSWMGHILQQKLWQNSQAVMDLRARQKANNSACSPRDISASLKGKNKHTSSSAVVLTRTVKRKTEENPEKLWEEFFGGSRIPQELLWISPASWSWGRLHLVESFTPLERM